MLNTNVNYQGGNNYHKINAVTGTLTKSHEKSFFKRFHLASKYAEKVLSDEPYFNKESRGGYLSEQVPIVILQMMVVGDMEVLAEIVSVNNYQEEQEVVE